MNGPKAFNRPIEKRENGPNAAHVFDPERFGVDFQTYLSVY